MIHYIKDENPEINSAIIEAANKTDLDPKAIALGAYMSYVMLETADKENEALLNNEGFMNLNNSLIVIMLYLLHGQRQNLSYCRHER